MEVSFLIFYYNQQTHN